MNFAVSLLVNSLWILFILICGATRALIGYCLLMMLQKLLLQVVQVVGLMVGTLLPAGVGSVWGLLLRIWGGVGEPPESDSMMMLVERVKIWCGSVAFSVPLARALSSGWVVGKSPTPMSTESVPLAAWLIFFAWMRVGHTEGWPYKTLPRWPRWGSRKAYVDAWWHPPMIVDESGDILRRLVFNLSCQWLWQHWMFGWAASLYIGPLGEKEERMAQLVECGKESASECVASIYVALHPLVILRHVMGRNQRKNPA